MDLLSIYRNTRIGILYSNGNANMRNILKYTRKILVTEGNLSKQGTYRMCNIFKRIHNAMRIIITWINTPLVP